MNINNLLTICRNLSQYAFKYSIIIILEERRISLQLKIYRNIYYIQKQLPKEAALNYEETINTKRL